MPTYSHLIWLAAGVIIALFIVPLLMGFFANKSSNS